MPERIQILPNQLSHRINRWVSLKVRRQIHPIQILAQRIGPITTIEHTIRIKKWHNFEHKQTPQHDRITILTIQY